MTLTFTNEQLAIIDRALGQMPYAQVAPLIADINRQIEEQQHGTSANVHSVGPDDGSASG